MNLCETFGRIQGVGSSWPRVIRMYNLTWVPTTYHRPASTLSSPIIWKCLLYTARGVSSWIWVNTFNVFTLYTHPTFSYLSLITCLLHHVLNAWLCWGHKSKDDNSTNKFFSNVPLFTRHAFLHSIDGRHPAVCLCIQWSQMQMENVALPHQYNRKYVINYHKYKYTKSLIQCQ